jgi:hypothetical protein
MLARQRGDGRTQLASGDGHFPIGQRGARLKTKGILRSRFLPMTLPFKDADPRISFNLFSLKQVWQLGYVRRDPSPSSRLSRFIDDCRTDSSSK